MSSIGDRLKEERERLGLSQSAAADIGGVQRTAQSNYERSNRSPDAGYLEALSRFGLDVLYVVTGVRSPAALTSDEEMLLTRYRALSSDAKLAMLTGGATPSQSPNISVGGDMGGYLNVTKGGNVTANVQMGKKPKK